MEISVILFCLFHNAKQTKLNLLLWDHRKSMPIQVCMYSLHIKPQFFTCLLTQRKAIIIYATIR